MNDKMIFCLWVMGVLGTTLGITIVCYTMIVIQGLKSSNGTASANALLSLTTRGGGLQFVTVVMVVITAFVLRANDMIAPDAFMSIASGVLGYVLGTARAGKAKQMPQSSGGALQISN